MRTLLAAALLCGTASVCSAADEPKKLGIGDPAPPLAVTKWLQGEPVASFAPGKVYVVDIWATWCGPCVDSMPHLNKLHVRHKGDGLTIVALTTKDPKNSIDAVEKFVKEKGSKYGFRYALCENEATDKAYMEASGQEGIPCSFVVDKAGKIAFIGHPTELDEVLPKVIAGTWRGQADVDETAKARKALEDIVELGIEDPKAALTEMAEYAKEYPAKAEESMFQLLRIEFLLSGKKVQEAKTATDLLMKKLLEKQDVYELVTLGDMWVSRETNPTREHRDLGVAAFDAALANGWAGGPDEMIEMAQAYFDAGKPEKAVELGEKALAAAENDKQKASLRKQLKRFKGKKDKPKASDAGKP